MHFQPFPPAPVGLHVAAPHAVPIGSRVLVLPTKQFEPLNPEIMYVHSYTKSTVRLLPPEHKEWSYPERSVYFKSEEWSVYEALEGTDRWLGLVRAYHKARNALRKVHLRTGDPYFAEALERSTDKLIPPVVASDLDRILGEITEAENLSSVARSIIRNATGDTALAETNRRVTEALRRIRNEIAGIEHLLEG